mgnify:CR=1 FL=1
MPNSLLPRLRMATPGNLYCVGVVFLFNLFVPTMQLSAQNNTSESLASQLEAKKAAFNAAASDEKKQAYAQGILEVEQSAAMANALRQGDRAPDFRLPAATGEMIRLSELLAEGPVVLTWYRGGWCPYCNISLRAYQQALPEIYQQGGQLVAISPELPDSSLSTQQKNDLEFYVLSDVGQQVAQEYNVVYTLPQGVIEQFKGRLDIPAYNGDDTWQLPLAVTYVIDTDRRIRYAFVDADYRKRAEPAELIEALKAIREE